MSSQIVDVASAVVSALNSASLSQTFTAKRKWVPKEELPNLSDLKVTVVPKDYARTNETRGQVRRTMQVDIGIQKLVATTTNAEDSTKLTEIDALMQFVEEVADSFVLGTQRYGGARCVKAEIPEPMYDLNTLDSEHVFHSVVTVTFTRV